MKWVGEKPPTSLLIQEYQQTPYIQTRPEKVWQDPKDMPI